jgi:hypothetical protein
MPRWRRDGKELFYISPDNEMVAVEVAVTPVLPQRDPSTPLSNKYRRYRNQERADELGHRPRRPVPDYHRHFRRYIGQRNPELAHSLVELKSGAPGCGH